MPKPPTTRYSMPQAPLRAAGSRLSLTVMLAGVASLGALLPASAAMAQDQAQESTQVALPNIYVWGRATQMLGQADSASHGIVGNADFTTRPMMRVGELVEVVPGMIATQHSGPGKANQYFLRGMNLDHGSDFAGYFEGMPVNMRSHAHASGYLDLNFIIPEIIQTVEFHKGTYYAANGDFSAAGAARFRTYDRVDDGYVEATFGSFDHHRLLAVNSVDLSEGTLLLAGEAQHRDGPWELEQDLRKYNVFGKYTGTLMGIDSQISFSGYDASWVSTDQIPLRAVLSGDLGRFGYIDPDLGGESSRYSLIGNFALEQFDLNMYYSRYSMNLFSNPTYFMEDPVNGDEFEQEDRRSVMGGSLTWSEDYLWGARTVSPVLGIDVRYDDVDEVNLFSTVSRQRIGAVREDALEQLSTSVYGEVQILWSDSFRSTVGLRAERYSWDAHSPLAANSGSGNDTIVMPKFTAAWLPLDDYEIYVSYGHGFHSNDVRGAELTIDPVEGTPVEPVDVLVRARGAEVGLRGEPLPGVNFTAALYWMELDSELLFVGDAGTSEPNDPTKRHGLELSAFWEINDFLVLDANATWNRARFIDTPAGINHVPDAHETTASAGLTYVHPRGMTASLRMRHFGDAPLEESNSFQKEGTTLFNLGLSYPVNQALEISFDLLNIFNTGGNDIEYWFESQLQSETAAVADFHFHPVESRAYRAMLKYRF